MKLLAINFGGLGDEVLFLPTLKSIKSHLPEWHITLLTEPRARSIKQLTNLIDEVITFDIKKRPLYPGDYFELVSLLKRGQYDVILSSGGSMQVSALLYLSGIKKRIGYHSGPLSKMLLTSAVPLNKNQYAGCMYHDLVRGLGIEALPGDPEVVLVEDSLRRMREFVSESFGAGTGSGGAPRARVIIHPGTSKLAILKGIIKVWAAENWCDLVERLLAGGNDVILAGGPEDQDAVAEIMSKIQTNAELSPGRNRGKFVSAAGKTTNVADLAALIHLCTLMVCVDSAPMHIAAGVGTPLVALFGPTDPAKLLPRRAEFIALKEPPRTEETRHAYSVQIPVDLVFEKATHLLRTVSVTGPASA